ncbi:MAG: dihydrolipoamide acetyltransferase [Bacteroidales bacterium]|nr:dihydrolipoamide acetyltransferase [Bacteroidales bacterium]
MENKKMRATPAARALAKRLGVDLLSVIGTGFKGRIHRDDVAGFNYEDKTHVSPLAQRIADIHNIDLKGLTGTGFRNKIMKDDVLQFIDDPEIKSRFMLDDYGYQMVSSGPVATKTIPVKQAETAKREIVLDTAKIGDSETIQMTQMRKIISKRMSESYFDAPTFIQTWEIDMTELLALRKRLIDPIMEKTGKRVTVTDLISMAVIKTLPKHKYINSSMNKEATEITFHNYVNLGMAVGLDEGLMVPVVKGADKMTLTEFVVAMKDLTDRTLSKKLLPDEQAGSTFTISNLGMYGVDEFTAIINQPNAAILSVASTQQRAVPKDGEIVIRPIMKISLTSDHRIIDGLTAAKFMTDLKAAMEDPLTLFI